MFFVFLKNTNIYIARREKIWIIFNHNELFHQNLQKEKIIKTKEKFNMKKSKTQSATSTKTNTVTDSILWLWITIVLEIITGKKTYRT